MRVLSTGEYACREKFVCVLEFVYEGPELADDVTDGLVMFESVLDCQAEERGVRVFGDESAFYDWVCLFGGGEGEEEVELVFVCSNVGQDVLCSGGGDV